MKLSRVGLAVGLAFSPAAVAGGLVLPGAGAVSTARAGTGAASADGAEAISLNPAGIAKTTGTSITIGFTALSYNMSFQRNGTYDMHDNAAEPYEGQPYPLVENTSKPQLGIGSYQPLPVIGIVSDLGGRVPNLHAGFGLFTTNAYPFRNMNTVNGQPYFIPNDRGGYDFPGTFGEPPPPTRYDTIETDAAIVLPSVVAAYSITPDLDIGARFSAGWAHVKSTVAIWGGLANYDEWIQQDGLFTLDAKDPFVMGFGFGATYRPTPQIEIGANFNGPLSMRAEGDAQSTTGPAVSVGGQPAYVIPVEDGDARCAKGGTDEVLKGCVEFALPMMATLGGRYKFLGADGKLLGDLELNVDWQNWSADRASNFRVVVDAQVTTDPTMDVGIALKDSIIAHGLRDTWGVRLGGSWNFAAGDNTVIARGGVGYETGAAKEGWERVDFDGAARILTTAGASYKMSRVQIDAGFGVAFQGTRTDDRTCNPVLMTPAEGCGAGGAVQPIADRQGPDPTNPLVTPDSQAENPVNQGTMKSHYMMFMLGASTWF